AVAPVHLRLVARRGLETNGQSLLCARGHSQHMNEAAQRDDGTDVTLRLNLVEEAHRREAALAVARFDVRLERVEQRAACARLGWCWSLLLEHAADGVA